MPGEPYRRAMRTSSASAERIQIASTSAISVAWSAGSVSMVGVVMGAPLGGLSGCIRSEGLRQPLREDERRPRRGPVEMRLVRLGAQMAGECVLQLVAGVQPVAKVVALLRLLRFRHDLLMAVRADRALVAGVCALPTAGTTRHNHRRYQRER